MSGVRVAARVAVWVVSGIAFALGIGCNDNKLGAAGGADIAVNPESLAFTTAAFNGGGTSASLTIIVSNEGKGVLTLNDIKFTPETSPEIAWNFGGTSNLPMDLGPAGWVAVQVVYTPTDYVQDLGTLLVFSTDPDEPIVEVPITTPLLGPQLACTPNPAVFIQAPGTPTTRTISCANAGTAPITVTGFDFAAGTSAEFTSSFTAAPVTLEAGDPLDPFTVTYTPGQLGPDVGQILVHNDTGSDYVIELSGEGTDQPLCDLSAFPFFVNWGSVLLGSQVDKQVILSNNGSGACHITGAQIGALTTEWTYVSNQTYTINPGASQIVSVRYRPIDRIPDFGSLIVHSDDPAEPDLSVLLYGVGAGPEIDVLPCPTNFGLVTVGCKLDKTISIYNTGDLALSISNVTVTGQGFSLATTYPTSVPVNGSANVNVRFQPSSTGLKTGILTVYSNDGDEPTFQCALNGEGTNNSHQIDNFVQSDEPQADILFVVDNSGSMGDEQQSLANSFADFAAYLVSQNVSYHVGVTTTDIDTFAGQHGELVGNPKIIDNNTPNAAAKFAANANVGTNGDATEQGLEAARLAITPPNLTGANAGFLRQAAKLFLIFVSDEEDQSPDGNGSQPSSYFVNAYRNAKNNDPALLSASAIAGDVPNGCSNNGQGAAAGVRYKEVVDAIGGVWSTICTTNFGPALHNIGVEAAELQATFYLSRVPVVSSIVVRVNNVVQPVTTNWNYNSAVNSVTFTSGHIPNPGDAIKIEYDVVCQ